MNPLKQARRFLNEENRKWDNVLKPVPPDEWPPARAGVPRPTQIMRSKEFLVQIYEEKDWVRLSICRTALDRNGGWKTGIDWETMQRLKGECGYRHRDGGEVYPPMMATTRTQATCNGGCAVRLNAYIKMDRAKHIHVP